eukprot:TRINITY_DN8446_c0_g1_i2.p1 TRINITY_DN8446_c0_g1~~TRINITY_DN8446_c0_g1_i2.p1  ORF type:complete len:204 (+),score=33.17 TRINITY_DN8446_c0_g1_i2:162-773(+)
MDSADDLVGMLQTLGTEDRPVLMQRLMELCPDLSPEAAQFFLEANNWNLAEAAGSYFEQGGSRAVVTQAQPEAELVCDVTFGDGEPVPPDTIFDKTWRLRNVGQEAWPRNTLLVFAQGDRIQLENEIRVPSLAPGQVSVNVARYSSHFYSWLCWPAVLMESCRVDERTPQLSPLKSQGSTLLLSACVRTMDTALTLASQFGWL